MHGTNGSREPEADDYQHQIDAIAEWFGDEPTTVISLHFLREGRADVSCVGSPHDPEAVVIQIADYPEEPTAWGEAEAIASVLPMLSGWTCLNVPAGVAGDLVDAVRHAAGAASVRLMDDVYFTLPEPVLAFPLLDVRLLTAEDRDLLDAASPELVGGNADALLEEMTWGHVAGAIRDGQLVAIAHTFARSERHVDIGVATLERWRRQGLATATAVLVAVAVQDGGRIPVWSCGGTNAASLATARRLGFQEVDRRVYLIPECEKGGGG